MQLNEKKGTLDSITVGDRHIDRITVQWFETGKRILHKQTASGQPVVLKFLNAAPQLTQGDVVHEDDERLFVIEVAPCEAIVLRPQTLYEMAVICYEIGNKHLPLFFEDDCVMIPFEAPIYRMLQAAGFNPGLENRKLLQPLQTTVAAHTHRDSGTSLFSKILKRTTDVR